jgi:site-specific DNA-methyltransferase (adenine-specific)
MPDATEAPALTAEAPYRIAPAIEALAVPIDSVEQWPGNPRRGSVEKLQASLRRWGQPRPILVQKSSGRIVAGNHLHRAAKALGWDQIAASVVDMTDTEAEAYLLADNQLSDTSTNDPEALTAWLQKLYDEGAVDAAIGFSSEELDRFLAGVAAGSTEADDVPDTPADRDIYVKPGELWKLGRHRVLCGDATDPMAYARILGNEQAGMLWTDPPYGVEYVGKTEEQLVIANDATDEDALSALLRSAFRLAVDQLRPGGAVYVAAPGGSMGTAFVAALKELGVYRQTIVWVKDVFVMGRSDYHWRHELLHNGAKPDEGKKSKVKSAQPVHYGWRPGAAHYFVTDRTLDTVWEIDRPKASREHPTMKPVELVERSITSSSKRGDIVLDPFAGSGTTIIAAERTDRYAAAIELEPRYAQVCIERWARYTGKRPERL